VTIDPPDFDAAFAARLDTLFAWRRDVRRFRPVPLDAELRVRTRTVRIGRTTGQLSAEVSPADHPEEILATATGVFSIRR